MASSRARLPCCARYREATDGLRLRRRRLPGLARLVSGARRAVLRPPSPQQPSGGALGPLSAGCGRPSRTPSGSGACGERLDLGRALAQVKITYRNRRIRRDWQAPHRDRAHDRPPHHRTVKESTKFLDLAIFCAGQSGADGESTSPRQEGIHCATTASYDPGARCVYRMAAREYCPPLAFSEQEGLAAARHPQDQGIVKLRVLDEDWPVYEAFIDADSDLPRRGVGLRASA